MAEYGAPGGREYSRPAQYGPSTNTQRDAAFSSIFGARPPPGRTQTMGMQSPQGPTERAQTMSSQTVDMMQRAPPMRPQANGYPPPQANGYHQPPPQEFSQSNSQMRPAPPQNMPPPVRTDRRAYPVPQRLDSRAPPSQQFPNRNLPNRGPQGAPALNSDPFRSQSLATMPRSAFQGSGNGPGYSISPAHTFRQQPYMNHHSRTTAQGRIVPERPDERTMSMSSYSRDSDYTQTMSGRVIPNRRRDSGSGNYQELGRNGHSASDSFGSNAPPSPSSNTRSDSKEGDVSAGNSRTMSMASTVAPSEVSDATLRPSMSKSNSLSTQQNVVVQKKAPLVYPAMLSRVADTFRDRIGTAEKEKDGLLYSAVFTGAEAVDLIAYIIKTTDRNLALLLGRSLDAQKLFHDVTYNHRLRDSPAELYRFRETIVEDATEVNGVFTLLTECYSPTCTRDRLCYSIACPRRLEQQARLNIKAGPGLKREESKASLHDDVAESQKLWSSTVPKEILDSVDDKEKKRQEVISELMYTERDFVKDLEYLEDFWIKPLRSTDSAHPSPIPEHRREKFIRTVFSNVKEVLNTNSKLAEQLTRRQGQNPVVHAVGDIFLDWVPNCEPFIRYGASQLFGKFEFEREKSNNPAFSRFVDETERLKESRKLELNGYLTKPTTRLARYPLLLEQISKATKDDNPDKRDLPKAISAVKDWLTRVNAQTGKAENHFNLMQLNQSLKFRPGEYIDLKLTEDNRQIVFKGSLKKGPTDNTGDIITYLFDHAVLLVREKVVNKKNEQKVYKKPIPLELLVITQMDEVLPKQGIAKRPSSSFMTGARSMTSNTPKADPKQQGYPITFKHIGKGGYETTLWATTHVQRRKWMEHIEKQQRSLQERSTVYTQTILNDNFFSATMKCISNFFSPYEDGGRKLVYGTDVGVYVSERKGKEPATRPKRVLENRNVTQIDVLEQHQILLVLSDKTVYSFPLEALDPEDAQNAMTRRGRRICHANFFKVGICTGQHLVCCVKTSALSSTIKVYEPMDSMTKGKKKSGFSRMLAGGQDVLKPYKEFYIPSDSNSIHFLKSKLCVGCARGFEVVSLETLETQSLLDQADTSLDFVQRRESIKPVHIERLASEFLLCYTDFSFFVNRNGWRARQEWVINWEGNPTAFAIFNQYILAFEPSFIEIRHMETAGLVAVIVGKNMRMLHSSNREVRQTPPQVGTATVANQVGQILYAYEDEMGEDVIASLDFWARNN
ncbi:MAG: RHO1 GDP-GTP exchange protein 2 [Bogoriella megaspora]|nr:MAG: RHO1 GDP-GTP exchange protein 2 [Bogoriella megaspora]